MVKLDNDVAYTVEDVAKIIDRVPESVRTYIRSGRLRAQKIGRSYFISGKDLEKFKRNGLNDNRP